MARVLVDGQAEAVVLASVIGDEEIRSLHGDSVIPAVFGSAETRAVAEVVAALRGKPLDYGVVRSSLLARGWFPEPVSESALMSLMSRATVSARVVGAHLERVRELWAVREARRVLSEALNDEESDAEALVAAAARKLGQIETGKARQITPISDDFQDFMDDLEAEARAAPGTEIRSTGFAAVDAVTGGYEDGLPHLYAARPGVGKSSHAVASVRASAGLRREPTAVFWLEDTKRKFCLRLAAAEAHLPAVLLRHGKTVSQEMWRQLVLTAERVSAWPLYVEPAKGMTAVQIAARMRRLNREKGVRRFFVDHLGEMKLPDDERRDEALGEALRVYRDTLDELKSGGAIYHQLGRKADQGGTPNLSWLFNSDVVGQVARVVGFIDRKDRQVDIYFAKATYGPPGVTVELAWDPQSMAIFEPQAR